MAVLTQKPAAWESYQRRLPEGYRAIKTNEALSEPAILKEARTFIDRNVKANKPIGHQEFKTVKGRRLLFTIEPHYHEPNGPTKPWGWHKGASVAINPSPAPALQQSAWPAQLVPRPSPINPYSNPYMTSTMHGERFNRFKLSLTSLYAKAKTRFHLKF
jgi:hypothetical protein